MRQGPHRLACSDNSLCSGLSLFVPRSLLIRCKDFSKGIQDKARRVIAHVAGPQFICNRVSALSRLRAVIIRSTSSGRAFSHPFSILLNLVGCILVSRASSSCLRPCLIRAILNSSPFILHFRSCRNILRTHRVSELAQSISNRFLGVGRKIDRLWLISR